MEITMRTNRGSFLFALGILAWTAAASATVTHYEVSGTVAAVQDDLNLFPGTAVYGQPFSATLDIDYQHPVLSLPPSSTSSDFYWIVNPAGQQGFHITFP